MNFHKKTVADEIVRIRMELDAAQSEYSPTTELKPEHFRAIRHMIELEKEYRFIAHLEQLCFGEVVRSAQEKTTKENERLAKVWFERNGNVVQFCEEVQ